MGVAPRGLHRAYLVDPTRVSLADRRGPSTAAACQLCAGAVATEALKILLRRGPVTAAPTHVHFDAYLTRLAKTWMPFGAAGPIQSLKRVVARRIYASMATQSSPPRPPAPTTPLDEILNLARWAPSGDNAQPWRFRIIDENSLTVEFHLDAGNVYEYRSGEPTLLSAGMLLESLRLAGTAWRRRMEWSYQGNAPGSHRVLVRFTEDPGLTPDPLVGHLTSRTVDRRSYRSRPLRAAEKSALIAALGPKLNLRWYEFRWRARRARPPWDDRHRHPPADAGDISDP